MAKRAPLRHARASRIVPGETKLGERPTKKEGNAGKWRDCAGTAEPLARFASSWHWAGTGTPSPSRGGAGEARVPLSHGVLLSASACLSARRNKLDLFIIGGSRAARVQNAKKIKEGESRFFHVFAAEEPRGEVTLNRASKGRRRQRRQEDRGPATEFNPSHARGVHYVHCKSSPVTSFASAGAEGLTPAQRTQRRIGRGRRTRPGGLWPARGSR